MSMFVFAGSAQFIAAELFKAANIREGKSMPAFVNLPLVAEAEKGGKQ